MVKEGRMELEQLRQLEAIASNGTLSKAAEQMHLSQSALSRSIPVSYTHLDVYKRQALSEAAVKPREIGFSSAK